MAQRGTITAAMKLFHCASDLHEKGLLAYWMTATEPGRHKYHIRELDKAVDEMVKRIQAYKDARANDIEPEEMEAAE